MSAPVRQRKTKDPCEGCGLHRDRCLCNEIPHLDLRTRVCLVIHARELKRTTNTGGLALRALKNSLMRVRGDDRKRLDLSDLLTEEYRSVLFYPSDDAVELDARFIAQDPRPLQLIVPDGNWRQAGKVHTRHPELRDLPRVRIGAINTSKLHLRAEHKPEGMATLEAIAAALSIVEGPDCGRALQDLYLHKLHRTLQARGIQKPGTD